MKTWKHSIFGMVAIIALAFTACSDENANSNETENGNDGGTYIPGTILLTTRWNGNVPFNNLTPVVDDKKTPSGCGTVAMVQIMKYHEHPKGPMTGTIPAYTTTTLGLQIPATDLSNITFGDLN